MESYGSETEHQAVESLRAAVDTIIALRRREDVSLRQLAEMTAPGAQPTRQAQSAQRENPERQPQPQRPLALSVLHNLEQGSSWPALGTLATVARTFGLRVRVRWPEVSQACATGLAATLEARNTELRNCPQTAWAVTICTEIAQRLDSEKWATDFAARSCGLRPNTVAAIRRGVRDPGAAERRSLRTYLALIVPLRGSLILQDARDPWRYMPRPVQLTM